jgi:hypothetical protein
MGKQTGLGANFYIGGFNVSGDTNDLNNLRGGPKTGDATDITQFGHARFGLTRDGEVNFKVFFNPAPQAAHAALATLPYTDVITTAVMPPVAVGALALSQNSKQINYDWKREKDGMLLGDVHCESQGFGQEWGILLTPGVRTDAAPTVGAFFDNLASFAFGAQAYLQVFSFTGTSVTIDIQHATTSGGSYTSTGLTASGIVAGNQSIRLSVPNNTTINEFLKVVTTGTFSNVSFALQISVNPVAGIVF